MNVRKRVRYAVGRAVLSSLGWREEGSVPDAPRFVLLAAPHTTWWDLPISLGVGYVMDLDIVWVGKHTLFEGPFGGFMRWLGGVPVDRRKSHNYVQQIAELIHSRASRLNPPRAAFTRRPADASQPAVVPSAVRASARSRSGA